MLHVDKDQAEFAASPGRLLGLTSGSQLLLVVLVKRLLGVTGGMPPAANVEAPMDTTTGTEPVSPPPTPASNSLEGETTPAFL